MKTYKAEKYIRDVELLRNQANRLTVESNRNMKNDLGYAIRQRDEELKQIIGCYPSALDTVLAGLVHDYTRQLNHLDGRTLQGHLEETVLIPLAILECDLNIVLDILGGSV